MSKFLEYLNEKTFRIGGDVDLIYKKLIHPYIKLLPDINKFIAKIDKNAFDSMKSSELKTKDCKKAHKLNPITIKFGMFPNPAYIPGESLIKVSLNPSVIELLITQKTMDDIERLIGTNNKKKFLNELSPANIKSSIYHELSHWLNDTLHNKNISKRLKIANQSGNFDIIKKYGDAVFTDYELDAQVHAIKQLKRDYKKDWDKLTWSDIIEKKGSFDVIFRRLKTLNTRDQKEYFKRMIKRLNREGLLGKKLRNSFIKAIEKV